MNDLLGHVGAASIAICALGYLVLDAIRTICRVEVQNMFDVDEPHF